MAKGGHNRRDLLSLMGLTAGGVLIHSPLLALFDTILRGAVGKAYAQAAGLNPRKWVDMRLNNAPPRWVYDLILQTGGAAFVNNAQVGTRYVASGGRYTSVEYATVLRNGINVPWIWQFPVPRAGGGTRPMTDLLPNFMNLRGVTTNNPGHVGSQTLHFLPLGLQQSLPALSADASSAPLAAVYSTTPNFKFRSKAGRSAALTVGSNLVLSLMDPFVSAASAAFKTNKLALNDYVMAAKQALADEATAAHGNAVIVNDALKSADELVMGSFGNLTTVWNTLLAKYNDLINRAFDPTVVLAGINDMPIGTTGARNNEYRHSSVIVNNADMRTMIDGTTNIGLAAPFALIEFVLMNDLSDSITLSLPPTTGMLINGGRVTHVFDEHFTGKMPSLIINSYFARAHAACMLELIDRLKAKGIFNDTVINTSGEFNRSPQDNGTGSDHGYWASHSALFSGAIKSPQIVGNVRANAPVGAHAGTWGYNAGIDALGGQVLDLGHMANAIAKMLRVPPPSTAKDTILTESATNGITPVIEAGKLV